MRILLGATSAVSASSLEYLSACTCSEALVRSLKLFEVLLSCSADWTAKQGAEMIPNLVLGKVLGAGMQVGTRSSQHHLQKLQPQIYTPGCCTRIRVTLCLGSYVSRTSALGAVPCDNSLGVTDPAAGGGDVLRSSGCKLRRSCH